MCPINPVGCQGCLDVSAVWSYAQYRAKRASRGSRALRAKACHYAQAIFIFCWGHILGSTQEGLARKRSYMPGPSIRLVWLSSSRGTNPSSARLPFFVFGGLRQRQNCPFCLHLHSPHTSWRLCWGWSRGSCLNQSKQLRGPIRRLRRRGGWRA